LVVAVDAVVVAVIAVVVGLFVVVVVVVVATSFAPRVSRKARGWGGLAWPNE
jgi:hypothetical protein